MWKLTSPSKDLINWYEKKMCTSLVSRIKVSLDRRISKVLIPTLPTGGDDLSIVKRLLFEKPQKLYILNGKLMREIIPGYDESEFNDYLESKGKKCNNRSNYDKLLIRKYHKTLITIRDAFDYEGQLAQNKSRTYRITFEQGHNTCTYCNRQYTITITKDNGNNNESRIARPQLDHWFSKELYPLMSLSLYNLIPCCSICNSSLKGNTIFKLSTHVHPYLDSTPDEPKFKFSYKLIDIEKCEVTIENLTDPKDRKEINMVEVFKLKEAYKYHGDIEVKDILKYNYQYSDTYLQTLLDNLLEHYKLSKADVYRMLFGTELEASKNLNRPLSKLKRDILTEIGILKDGNF